MNGIGLTISRIGAEAGVGARAIRLYEAQGLLTPATRAPNGYRVYPAETIDRLRFIKYAQDLGFTLAEIKNIVSIREGGALPCDHVWVVLKNKLAELDKEMADLMQLRHQLRWVLRGWSRAPTKRAVVCPHIEQNYLRRLSGRTSRDC